MDMLREMANNSLFRNKCRLCANHDIELQNIYPNQPILYQKNFQPTQPPTKYTELGLDRELDLKTCGTMATPNPLVKSEKEKQPAIIICVKIILDTVKVGTLCIIVFIHIF